MQSLNGPSAPPPPSHPRSIARINGRNAAPMRYVNVCPLIHISYRPPGADDPCCCLRVRAQARSLRPPTMRLYVFAASLEEHLLCTAQSTAWQTLLSERPATVNMAHLDSALMRDGRYDGPPQYRVSTEHLWVLRSITSIRRWSGAREFYET